MDAALRVLRRRDDYDAWAEPMGAGTITHDVCGGEYKFQDFERTGLAVRPTGLGIGSELFGLMAERLTLGGTKSVGQFLPIEKADAEAIYRLAL